MRSKYGILLIIAFLIPAQAETFDLTIGKVIERVIQHDSNIRISLDNLKIANLKYKETLADSTPNLDLDETGYGLSKKKEQLTNTFELGLAYSQKIPTSGSLSFGLENDFYLRLREGEDVTYRQEPSLSFGWTQPLFVNGKVIDMEVFPSVRQKAEIERRKTQETNNETTNSVIIDALALFFDVVNKRNDARYQENRLEWHRRDLLNLEKKRDLKLITETEVWEKKLEIGDLEEDLYALKLELQESEKNLAHSLGFDDITDLVLDEYLPSVQLEESKDNLSQKVIKRNPAVLKEELALKSARMDLIIGDLDYAATLETELSFTPKYPYESSSVTIWNTSFQESFAKFLERDSDYNLTFSLLLTIPLIDGGKRALTKEKNQASERIAFQKFQTQKQLTVKDLEIALQKRSNLIEKVNLLEDHVQLNKKQLEIQDKLFELKQITEHDVKSVKLDLDNQRIKLWRARADLLLATLDLYSITGENLSHLLKEYK
jgi:outer membrane protein TolC